MKHSTWTLRDALTAFALVIVASGLATGLLVVATGQDVGDGGRSPSSSESSGRPSG